MVPKRFLTSLTV